MSLLPALHRNGGSLMPDLSEWFPGFPPLTEWRPMFDSHLIKVEDESAEGKYVVRAEIPGIDPAKDVAVTVRDGVLTIKAERSERTEAKGRSEFSYGAFTRSLALPAGADEDKIEADYAKGILTVTVAVSQPQGSAKQIEVKSAE